MRAAAVGAALVARAARTWPYRRKALSGFARTFSISVIGALWWCWQNSMTW
jgi:hypothetical protein